MTGRRWEHFQYGERGGVATVTFDRPERLNSLTFEVYADIRDLAAELKMRPDEVRVLVIEAIGWRVAGFLNVDAPRGFRPDIVVAWREVERIRMAIP